LAISVDVADVAGAPPHPVRIREGRRLMTRRPRARFWVEAGLGQLSATLFVVTLFVPNWIEAFFGVGPDEGSGSLEWAVVAVLFVTAIVSSVLARREWRCRVGLSTTR